MENDPLEEEPVEVVPTGLKNNKVYSISKLRRGNFVLKRNDDFLLRRVGEANILVPLRQKVVNLQGVITLNETGAFIWELLKEERTPDELAEALVEEFDVEFDQAKKDVEEFLKQLKELGALQD